LKIITSFFLGSDYPWEVDAKQMVIIRRKILATFWSCGIWISGGMGQYGFIFSLSPRKHLKLFLGRICFP
jgi:hypothetical protein